MFEALTKQVRTLLASACLPSLTAVVAAALALPFCSVVVGLLDRFDGVPDSAERAAKAAPPAFRVDEPITPVPTPTNLNPIKVALGRALFHDPGLSASGTVSCASCHQVDGGGDDGKRFSTGIRDQTGGVNSPTVLNAALNFRQFWDGRAATLEEQVAGPIHSPIEMGSTWETVITFLEGDAAYRQWFQQVYSHPVNEAAIVDAIAEYERSLVTPDSPFDRWLKGDNHAISEQQKRGYALFKQYGCTSCHQGENVGGNLFQKLGVMVDYFDEQSSGGVDNGRYNVTADERDRHTFKVPGLRNVARTAPYFHDGSAESLEEAIGVMFRHQIGLEADSGTVAAIRSFLESLTAEPWKETR